MGDLKFDIISVESVFVKDRNISNLLNRFGLPESGVEMDMFNALIRSIIAQQLSIKAARTIYGRFRDLFETKPTPENLLKIKKETLRSAGLSGQKSGYVLGTAQFFIDNKLYDKDWSKLSDNEIIELLTQIKGVGVWTVQMLLMFTLDRPDVFPVDDLGIQKGMKVLYGLESEGKVLKQQIIEIAENWRPYRSIGSKLIWMGKDTI